jgi:RNA polymerase sigma-70 factor (ECF subfamily)
MTRPPAHVLDFKAILSRVARLTRTQSDAEDLLQSAFVRLLEYRAKHVVENETAFLVHTAANIAVDESRKRKVRAEPAAAMELLAEIADEQPLQDEALLARERLKRVRAALHTLSPRTREIYLRHRLDGRKYREIAAEFGITSSAVEKHIAKASMAITELSEPS